MIQPEFPPPPASGGDRCLACGALLAHDQRYCLHCGARRGSLPPRIAASLLALSGHAPDPLGSVAPAEQETLAHGRWSGDIIPLARAAAVSILLMLGLGAVFGAALRPGGVESLARDVVVVVHHPAPAPAAVASTPASSFSAGGGGSVGAGGGGSPASNAGGSGGGFGSGGANGLGSGSGSRSGSGSGSGSGGGPQPATKLPPIGHVWEIVLSGQGYAQSFGTTKGHAYLSKTLADQGELITQYDAVASSPLANEVALISGQGPTEQTITDCPSYFDITPGTTGKLGQVLGSGCLYPSSTETLGRQLQVDGLSWRAYIQGIGSAGQRHEGTATTTSTTTSTTTTSTTSSSPATARLTDTSTATGCPHPAENATDGSQTIGAKDDYVTWKNPWVYFHSVVDRRAACTRDDVGLARLAKDLRKDSTTPAFSYIAPDPCDDGSDTPCRPGARGGLGRADAFLRSVVPEIERSVAYKADGLILITFDQAPQSGPDWSTASCCGEPTFPNLVASSAGSTTTPSTTAGTVPPTSTTTSTVPAGTTGAGTTGTTSTPGTPATGCPTTTSTTPTAPITATTPTTPMTTTTATTTTTTTTTTTSASTTTTTAGDCAPAIAGDPPGGGQVGLLMISPYIAPHTLNPIETYNHFSLLKSIENLFGLPHLGYTADKQVPAFIPSLFLSHKS